MKRLRVKDQRCTFTIEYKNTIFMEKWLLSLGFSGFLWITTHDPPFPTTSILAVISQIISNDKNVWWKDRIERVIWHGYVQIIGHLVRNLVKRLWAMIIGDSYKDFGDQNDFLPHNADKVIMDRRLKKKNI